ncbi:MAG: hypothetical protein INH37_06770 [Myxococcaceae bacterium]|nr:hypothetical protein [Myxococcaceae bacterium]
MTQPPYGSGASAVAFVDDTSFVTSIGALSTISGSSSGPFVSDGYVWLYASSGTPLRLLTQSSRSTVSLVVAPDRQRVAAGGGPTIHVVPLDGGTVTQLSGGNVGTSLAFTADSASLFAGGTNGFSFKAEIGRFDLASGQSLLADLLDTYEVVGLLPEANGTQVTVATRGLPSPSNKRSYRALLRSSDLSVQSRLPLPELTTFKRDPRTGGDFVATRNSVQGVTLPGADIVAAAPHPTQPKAVTLHFDGTLRLVDLFRRRVEDEIRANVRGYDVAVSPDGLQVVVAGIQPPLSAFVLLPGVRPPPAGVGPACGNGQRDPGEACDGNTGSCTSLGFGAGTWRCNSDCTIDRSACTGLTGGWSCPAQARSDGRCDCGCDAPDPDCGPNPSAAACDTSACQNGTRPAKNAPWTCAIDTCANMPAEGRCAQNSYERCDSAGMKHAVSCTCVARRGAPTCQVATMQNCLVNVGNSTVYYTCTGQGAACLYSGQPGGACVQNYAGCNSSAPACLGSDKLRFTCNGGQPVVYDCFALGGACQTNRCTGLQRNASCGPNFECAVGLSCTSGICQ